MGHRFKVVEDYKIGEGRTGVFCVVEVVGGRIVSYTGYKLECSSKEQAEELCEVVNRLSVVIVNTNK
jgi:hypothetical protein